MNNLKIAYCIAAILAITPEALAVKTNFSILNETNIKIYYSLSSAKKDALKEKTKEILPKKAQTQFDVSTIKDQSLLISTQPKPTVETSAIFTIKPSAKAYTNIYVTVKGTSPSTFTLTPQEKISNNVRPENIKLTKAPAGDRPTPALPVSEECDKLLRSEEGKKLLEGQLASKENLNNLYELSLQSDEGRDKALKALGTTHAQEFISKFNLTLNPDDKEKLETYYLSLVTNITNNFRLLVQVIESPEGKKFVENAVLKLDKKIIETAKKSPQEAAAKIQEYAASIAKDFIKTFEKEGITTAHEPRLSLILFKSISKAIIFVDSEKDISQGITKEASKAKKVKDVKIWLANSLTDNLMILQNTPQDQHSVKAKEIAKKMAEEFIKQRIGTTQQEIEDFFYKNLIQEATDIDKATQSAKAQELDKKAEETAAKKESEKTAAGIQAPPLPPRDGDKKPKREAATTSLLDQIKSGTTLKKVPEAEIKKKPEGDLAGILARAMAERRGTIQGDDDPEEAPWE